MITVGPTGKLSRGHVLDVNPRCFNETLRHYDPLLYAIWNPKKLRGWGCWEIRRKPLRKTALYQGTYQGVRIMKLVDLEFGASSHIMDCAYLNYDALRKLKEMDTYNKDHWIHDIEYRERKQREAVQAKAAAELRYNLRQERTAMRDMLEMVKSGHSPAEILTEIDWGSKS